MELGNRQEHEEDACDPYHQAVVQFMAANQQMPGLTKSNTELKTGWDVDSGSEGGSVSTFLRYRVEYFTPPGDLTTSTPR